MKELAKQRGYKVLSRDEIGPIVVTIKPMDILLTWVRMEYDEKKKDYWMELHSSHGPNDNRPKEPSAG